ncbi:redoxin domain-containing protein [Candidatus Kaiserbacteria bacterium]|nr:redoxin domain-containing protein [Candidatus Kaiserbacteria bacterium]
MTLLIISFVAGALTVLAPCILPLLPVVVGGSVSDSTNRFKPYIITLSLALSVIIFTLLLKVTTLVIDIPPSFWKWFSGGILLSLGIVLIFPTLWERLKFTAFLNSRSQQLLSKGNRVNNIGGDILMGVALGPVFSTCSPTYFVILATVLPSSFALGMVYLFAYTLGLTLVLILIALLGQNLVTKLGGAADPRGVVKRGMGVVIVLVGLAIVTGYDKVVETAILDAGFFDVTTLEQRLLKTVDMPKGSDINMGALKDGAMNDERPGGPLAPELSGISGYLNTGDEAITLERYKGEKIVLVDFWTYSCINCRRTLPYLNTWYERYKDQGLEIIGVHTPEFAFEQRRENIETAIADFGIKYPVVLDNEYRTWGAFGNKFWPRKYLIDERGVIIYDHIGEGAYDETEAAIVKALKRLGSLADENTIGGIEGTTEVDFKSVDSPETYFGSSRNEYLGNGTKNQSGINNFIRPETIERNKFYLAGRWQIEDEYATNLDDGSITYQFTAKNVYMVLGAQSGVVETEVFIDGNLISLDESGADVVAGKMMVDRERMYHVFESETYGTHTLELRFKPGVKAFTFTFG